MGDRRFWIHFCRCENTVLGVQTGDDCNWCGLSCDQGPSNPPPKKIELPGLSEIVQARLAFDPIKVGGQSAARYSESRLV